MAYPTKLSKKAASEKVPKLHVKGTILGYRRSRQVTNSNQTLIRIEGVNTREAARYYLGKKIGYYYRCKTKKNGTNLRVVWGKVMAQHGNSGVVRAKFDTNLCPTAFASDCRVYMYPCNL